MMRAAIAAPGAAAALGTTLAMAAALAAAGCAARVPPRPSGPFTTDPSAIQTFRDATRQCTGLKTLTAELRLSGRVGDEPLRGTLHTGLAAPGAVRFEALAPFGAPVFILAGRDNRATLFFPRESRVLPDARLADVLERLTGLALSGDDLRWILSGCLGDSATASEGRAWPGAWQAVKVGANVTAYLRPRGGSVIVVAADYGTWRVDYASHLNGWPRSVRIRGGDADRVDASARIDQLSVNTALDASAFAIAVSPDAERITLDDLRAIAPLRGTP